MLRQALSLVCDSPSTSPSPKSPAYLSLWIPTPTQGCLWFLVSIFQVDNSCTRGCLLPAFSARIQQFRQHRRSSFSNSDSCRRYLDLYHAASLISMCITLALVNVCRHSQAFAPCLPLAYEQSNVSAALIQLTKCSTNKTTVFCVRIALHSLSRW